MDNREEEENLRFEEGVDDFKDYERNPVEGRKSRNDKIKEKLGRLHADMKNPELKRERNQSRRNQEKAKLDRELEGLTPVEVREYLDKKKAMKQLGKQRAKKGLETGIPILIDMSYGGRMSQKENKSLALQIELIMKNIRHLQNPPGIHLCSVEGQAEEQLVKMGYHHWILNSNKEDVLEVAKKIGKKPVYLSPDAHDELEMIDPDTAYIIGGLVDRTVIKNASYYRSTELGIPSFRLPIRQFMKSRNCLNLDHVVMMISKFQETSDWKTAFDFGAPKRWKRDDRPDIADQQKQIEARDEAAHNEDLAADNEQQEDHLSPIKEEGQEERM